MNSQQTICKIYFLILQFIYILLMWPNAGGGAHEKEYESKF